MLEYPRRHVIQNSVSDTAILQCFQRAGASSQVAAKSFQRLFLSWARFDWAAQLPVSHVDHRHRRLGICIEARDDLQQVLLTPFNEAHKIMTADFQSFG